ncbi:MAG: hypothetical protein JNG90_07245 [Planctomycetaceae bacterium]|nr:hypothetical protein [Planctomycetaceae bacterium]
MPRLLALALGMSVALAAGLGDAPRLAAQGPIAPEIPPAIYSRQRVFSIPFKIEKAAPGGVQPRGVQLHVSEDQGRTWRVAEQLDPSAERFPFRAERDGEYWFFVRTQDEQGRLQPVGPPRPELRVIVDTLSPRLKLQQQIGPGGEVTATWQILDQNLKSDSFRLEFQPEGAGTWQAVNVPRDPRGDKKVMDGQVTWWPGASSGKIRVRANLVDLAGNPAVSQVDVDLDQRTATASPAPTANTDRLTSTRPGASAGGSVEEVAAVPAGPATGTGSTWNPDYSTREPFRPGSDLGQVKPLVEAPAAEATVQGEEVPAPPPAQSDPRGELTRGPDEGVAPLGRPVSTGYGDSAGYIPRETGDGAPESVEALPPGNTEPIEDRDLRFDDDGTLGDPRGTRVPGEPPEERPAAENAPQGEHVKYVNALRFELEYDVESVGPAGIGQVELWGTRDGGRSWETYGVDPDNRSPFVVTVDREGMYGFQIVVESGTGLGGLPPKSGDPAEVLIGVDLTAPVVELQGIEQGSDERAGELVIRWEARDALLGQRPVSLAFRDARGGEWATFASGLQNTGRHLWQIDRRVPEQIYLRVEVRDAAGNVAVADSFEPISLDRVRPQGRIRDVRPARDATQGARPVRTYLR